MKTIKQLCTTPAKLLTLTESYFRWEDEHTSISIPTTDTLGVYTFMMDSPSKRLTVIHGVKADSYYQVVELLELTSDSIGEFITGLNLDLDYYDFMEMYEQVKYLGYCFHKQRLFTLTYSNLTFQRVILSNESEKQQLISMLNINKAKAIQSIICAPVHFDEFKQAVDDSLRLSWFMLDGVEYRILTDEQVEKRVENLSDLIYYGYGKVLSSDGKFYVESHGYHIVLA